MRKLKIFSLTMLLALVGAISANADVFTYEGINYNPLTDTTCEVYYNLDRYSGDIDIPSVAIDPATSKEYTVVRVRSYCFSGDPITSIKLPNTVTRINESAFSSCTDLVSVELPNTVTFIGDYVFSGCTELSEINLSENLSSIKEGLFSGCSKLTEINIPEGVTSIGWAAFNNCSGLASVKIPDAVTSVSNYAFQNCSSLTSVVIGNNVTIIEDDTFYNCTSLQRIVLGKRLSSFGKAFFRCNLLQEITCLSSFVPEISRSNFMYIDFSTCLLRVPSQNLTAYAAANGWNLFANIGAIFNMSDAGMGTLYLNFAAIIPDELTAYYASSVDEDAVTMTKISDEVLPSGTGVVIKGDKGEYTFLKTTSSTSISGNLLVGTNSSGYTFNENGYNFYKLTYADSTHDQETFGFYLDKANGTVNSNPNKAYLKLPQAAKASYIKMRFIDDEMTDIQSVANEAAANSSDCYNLAGQKVGADYKGIVIKNGKKVIIK